MKTNAMRRLEAAGIRYRTVAYTYDPDNLDVAHIATQNDLPLEQVFKTLVCRGERSGVLVAVVPGDRQLSYKLLGQAAGGDKSITLVDAAELQRLTGYVRGGCSPIGMKKNLPVFLDQAAIQYDLIYINAGTRGLLLELSPMDLLRVSGATLAALSLP